MSSEKGENRILLERNVHFTIQMSGRRIPDEEKEMLLKTIRSRSALKALIT